MSNIPTQIAPESPMAPEIDAAIKAIDLPEVQEMIKQLSKYNLAVCVPHMHTTAQDFAVLPSGMVQVERQCRVSWDERSTVEAADVEMIPVAWRWEEGGAKPLATCWGYCAKTKDGHSQVHDKVD